MSSKQSIRGHYASCILEEYLTSLYNSKHPDKDRRGPIKLPDWHLPSRDVARREISPPSGKLGIIGAGVAGLYLAMMCDFLGIDYEILEASDRVGGRVYTHHFSEGATPIEHNYYDVGAMRFPDLEIMNPVFKLMDQLDVARAPYYLSSNSTPNLFHNLSVTSQEIDDRVAPLGVVVDPIIQELIKDFDSGFQKLLIADNFSTRSYLMNEADAKMSPAQVQTLETYDTGTGLYDQAFSETVLAYFDFNVAKNWFRVEGGTEQITLAMHKAINTKPLLHKRVNKIWYDGSEKVYIQVDDESTPRSYCSVFNTTTMGCLAQMDTSGLSLTEDQQTAIRALSYDRACKVAIKFSRAWWVEFGVEPGSGGSSSTDLPVRTVVYPSWIDDNDSSKPATIIVSYTWALDATRMGALIQSPSDPAQNKQLLDVILSNLSRIYNNKITAGELKNLVLEHHAFAWQHNPNTAGAYAFFGPGQFTSLYPAVQCPAAKGRFYMAGECVSTHHGWIVGALDSAYMQLLSFLVRFGLIDKAIELKESWFGDGKGCLVDEMWEKHIYWKPKLSEGVVMDS